MARLEAERRASSDRLAEIDQEIRTLSPVALPPDLELWIVGLLMAASVYSDCPEPSDVAAVMIVPDDGESFVAWCGSWDQLRPEFARRASELGWPDVGTNWEYHPDRGG